MQDAAGGAKAPSAASWPVGYPGLKPMPSVLCFQCPFPLFWGRGFYKKGGYFMGLSGTKSKSNGSGGTHTTDWDSGGLRYSRDIDSNGNVTNRHIVDQTDGEKHNLPDCKDSEDDLSRDNN